MGILGKIINRTLANRGWEINKLSEFHREVQAVRPWSMATADALLTLKKLACSVNVDGVEGDFVECGTCRGGSSALLATELKSRHLWLYDSFQGMPKTTPQDGTEAPKWIGTCAANQSDVEQALASVSCAKENYTIRPGWFQTTFKQPLPTAVALLHLDCDWYDSIMIGLRTFYPLMPRGGAIILDDFGCWEGTREAFYDWCVEAGEKPLLWRTGASQAHWIKGQTESREW